MIASPYLIAFSFITFLWAHEVPSPHKWNPKVICPWETAFLLTDEIVHVAFDFIVIPLYVVLFASNAGTPFFHRCEIRYQTHFFGAKSPPITCSKSRKNWMISSILFTIAFSSLVRSFSSIGNGYFVTSSSVIPVVLSSTKESPGFVLIVDLSTETSLIHSYFSSRAISISWLRSAHRIGDEQLPCHIPLRSF
jgi:hypothetical protein